MPRAIAFIGGDQPDFAAARELIGPYEYIVAADSGLLAARRAGIEPDLVVGDMDSLPDLAVLDTLPPNRVERHGRDKDETDTEIALAAARARGFGSVVLVGGSGGRMDHLLAIRDLFDRADPPEAWVCAESALFAVGAGSPRAAFTATGLAPEDPVSIFRCGTADDRAEVNWRASSTGLRWPVDGLDWNGGALSVSNRAEGGSFAFRAERGRFLVVVPLRAGIRVS